MLQLDALEQKLNKLETELSCIKQMLGVQGLIMDKSLVHRIKDGDKVGILKKIDGFSTSLSGFQKEFQDLRTSLREREILENYVKKDKSAIYSRLQKVDAIERVVTGAVAGILTDVANTIAKIDKINTMLLVIRGRLRELNARCSKLESSSESNERLLETVIKPQVDWLVAKQEEEFDSAADTSWAKGLQPEQIDTLKALPITDKKKNIISTILQLGSPTNSSSSSSSSSYSSSSSSSYEDVDPDSYYEEEQEE